MAERCPGPCRADPAAFEWFLGFLPHTLLHGHDVFVTDWLNYPYGVNLMVNASVFLLGILGAPITLLWGPIATLNVLLVVAIAGSATAAYAVFRRWTRWPPAAYAGGLLYGVSPYMVSQAQGHLNLLFVVFPPLVLAMLDEILVRQRRSALRWGIGLGLLAAAQFFVSPEVLASTFLLSAIALVSLIVLYRPQVAARARHAAIALGAAACACFLVLAYPLWVLLAGREHLSGPFQPPSALASVATDLAGLVVPSSNQWLAPAALQHVSDRFTLAAHPDENGAYLGLTLLVILVVMVVRLWRVGVVRLAAALGLAALVLSLGGRLAIDGADTGVTLPFRLLTKLPLLENSVAARYSLYVALFAGLILAVGVDSLRASGAIRIRRSRRVRGDVAAVAAASVALIPLIPAWPYAMNEVAVPAFFQPPNVHVIRKGSVVLTYPYPRWPFVQAMIWQAVGEMRYKLPGGYIYTAGPNGAATLQGPPSFTAERLEACAWGLRPEPVTTSVVRRVAGELRTWKVSTIVVTAEAAQPGCAVSLFTRVLGRNPIHTAGVWAWLNVTVES